MTTDSARLDEMDKTEWRDVCAIVRPDLTDEEFDQLWGEFQDRKAKRRAN